MIVCSFFSVLCHHFIIFSSISSNVILIMTSPCNGKALCFNAHPRVFFIWVKNFIYLDELPCYITNSKWPSVCMSPDKTNFNSKRYPSILEIVHIWINQDVEPKIMKRKFFISYFWKNIGVQQKFIKFSSRKVTNQFF